MDPNKAFKQRNMPKHDKRIVVELMFKTTTHLILTCRNCGEELHLQVAPYMTLRPDFCACPGCSGKEWEWKTL